MNAAPLILQQGIDSGFAWEIVDGTEPADLTGYTAKGQVRKQESVTSPLLEDLTCAVVGSSVAVQWTAEQSLAWNFTSGRGDVILINPAGRPVQVIWQGTMSVDPVVTDV